MHGQCSQYYNEKVNQLLLNYIWYSQLWLIYVTNEVIIYWKNKLTTLYITQFISLTKKTLYMSNNFLWIKLNWKHFNKANGECECQWKIQIEYKHFLKSSNREQYNTRERLLYTQTFSLMW